MAGSPPPRHPRRSGAPKPGTQWVGRRMGSALDHRPVQPATASRSWLSTSRRSAASRTRPRAGGPGRSGRPEQVAGGPVGLEDHPRGVRHEVPVRRQIEELPIAGGLDIELLLGLGQCLVLAVDLLRADLQLLDCRRDSSSISATRGGGGLPVAPSTRSDTASNRRMSASVWRSKSGAPAPAGRAVTRWCLRACP